MHDAERKSRVPPGSPAGRKPCPLTLSVSFKHFIGCVKHLSLWGLWRCGREGGREGGKGTGELTRQVSGLQQFTSRLPGNTYPAGVVLSDWIKLAPCCQDSLSSFLHSFNLNTAAWCSFRVKRLVTYLWWCMLVCADLKLHTNPNTYKKHKKTPQISPKHQKHTHTHT